MDVLIYFFFPLFSHFPPSETSVLVGPFYSFLYLNLSVVYLFVAVLQLVLACSVPSQ